jgi:vesicle coat complex subunit
VNTPDLVVKKMVFLYLTHYAIRNPELAILCINTLITDW